ncbi:unnamed protein product [Parnassius apollo]|uniref:(apollo) hypothetical protein n=1 Tax=Parnassius apollo TaxID=110799 RepID=A0A8S3XF15_PARAO|nr:unnamed protein product [Parnassius apollo]
MSWTSCDKRYNRSTAYYDIVKKKLFMACKETENVEEGNHIPCTAQKTSLLAATAAEGRRCLGANGDKNPQEREKGALKIGSELQGNKEKLVKNM